MSFAYCTLLTSDPYLAGALTLHQSLAQSGSPHDINIMVTPDTLSQHTLITLRRHFTNVVSIPSLVSLNTRNLGLLGRPDLDVTLTKIHLWNPHLLPYERVCFMDADTLCVQNIDSVFSYLNDADFAASPGISLLSSHNSMKDIGWPDCFNSGVFVARPCTATFTQLVQMAAEHASFDGGDQGLLNSFFNSWSGHSKQINGLRTNRLPFTYNVTPSAFYSYVPAYVKFKSDIRVVHFIGRVKPWNLKRNTDGSIADTTLDCFYSEKVYSWFRVYDTLNLHTPDKTEYFSSDSVDLSTPIHAPSPTRSLDVAIKEKEWFYKYHGRTPSQEQNLHAATDYHFAKTPGRLAPQPPPLPILSQQLTLNINPEFLQKSTAKQHYTDAQAPINFANGKIGWDARELIENKSPTFSPRYTPTQKLSIKTDWELAYRELSLDDHIFKSSASSSYHDLESSTSGYITPKHADKADYFSRAQTQLEKWMQQDTTNQEFSWGLTGGTKNYEKMLEVEKEWFLHSQRLASPKQKFAADIKEQKFEENKKEGDDSGLYAAASSLSTKEREVLVEGTFTDIHSRNLLEDRLGLIDVVKKAEEEQAFFTARQEEFDENALSPALVHGEVDEPIKTTNKQNCDTRTMDVMPSPIQISNSPLSTSDPPAVGDHASETKERFRTVRSVPYSTSTEKKSFK